jgi:hypothetical protein
VSRKFVLRDDVFINERLEQERTKQAEYRRRQSDNGRASAAARKEQPDGNGGSTVVATVVEPSPQPLGQPNFNSSVFGLQSSSSVPSKNDGTPPPRPLIAGEANPRTWGKLHGEHVTGFCDWVCLPDFIFGEFSRKSAGSDYVRGWALQVRATWEGRVIGDNLKFWRLRWAESHPELATKIVPIRDDSALDAAIDAAEARKAKR